MKKLFVISFLLLALTPALGANGNETVPMLISYQNQTQLMNQSMIQATVHEAIQLMNQTMNQTRLMINQTEIIVSSEGLMVNATPEREQLRISLQVMVVNGVELINASSPVMVRVNASINTTQGTKEINVIREQNNVRLMEAGSTTQVKLALNNELMLQENKLLLNASGVSKEVNMMPEQAMLLIKATNQTVKEIELAIEQEKAVYKINEQRQVRVLWLFPAMMTVNSKVDATSSELVSVQKPWWSFLAAEVE